jgi:hypothetical protein
LVAGGRRARRWLAGGPLGAQIRAGRHFLGFAFSFGRHHVRVHLVGFAQLLLRAGADAFCLFFTAAGFLPQALGFQIGLLRVGLGTHRFGITFPRSEFVGLGLFTHLGGAVPVRRHLALAADHDCDCHDREHHNDADDNSYELP